MARLDNNALTRWITAASLQHGNDLACHVAERTGASRRSAVRALRRLVALNWLACDGTPRRPRFRPGLLRQVVHRYALDGLQEDVPWRRDFAPFFVLPAHVSRMAQHAFCELVNNAVDHSEGTGVTVSMRQTQTQLQLLVSDDGRGVFDKIHEAFDVGDPADAMLELSKGKLTSQPHRHTGRGLFFTARLADIFDLHANAVAFQRRAWNSGEWLPGKGMTRSGTSVYAAIALDTARSVESVLHAYSADGTGYGFDRTVVPLGIVSSTAAGLESRAQARRVASRLDQFGRAERDFSGVTHIGHGFADELFRVLHGPGSAWVPMNMAPAVAAMVASVRGQ
jgi:anti-sigma regulatory factor (Ser/Thr protein kinase)